MALVEKQALRTVTQGGQETVLARRVVPNSS
jgi:hypothetical protein